MIPSWIVKDYTCKYLIVTQYEKTRLKYKQNMKQTALNSIKKYLYSVSSKLFPKLCIGIQPVINAVVTLKP